MVKRHPNRIDGAANDATERKDNAQQRRLLPAIVARMGHGVKIRRHPYTDADRNKRKHGRPRQRLLVQEEIDRGDGGRQEHAADLVEGDGGVGKGKVLQYHVQTHGAG